MSRSKINAAMVKKCFLAGAESLTAKADYINELNVFPVPDGDTGTNMSMTIEAAAKEVASLSDSCSMSELSRAISMGSLRGARGNSGVILSQFLRGFSKLAEENEELDAKLISAAFNRAAETAYKAVMKPKEGTILTVARGVAEKTSELAMDNSLKAGDFADEVLHHAEYVLSKTPDLLPVLKEAGVVDSGGQGLVEFIRGVADFVNKRKGERSEVKVLETKRNLSSEPDREVLEKADIKFAYCTEFILETKESISEKEEADLKNFLNSIGDSIVCVAMDKIVKVHVHTNHPGTVFEEALKLGELTSLKVDNMRKEHNERLFKNHSEEASDEQLEEKPAEAAEMKKYGFAAVASGDGLKDIFISLGADAVISGGQTMNPSTDDILKACEGINAETIFLFPNNKNILLASQQAASFSEDKKIIVIPSKTIPQGITAMIGFVEEYTAEENEKTMTDLLSTVKTGEITYAVRDTEIDGKKISEGDIIAIDDSTISAVGKAIDTTTMELIDNLTDDESSVITIYYGADMDAEQAERLSKKVADKYPDIEVEVSAGGQNVYYYIVSVE
ncbi:MAG: DAK2 domain-containing protein [Lachnospiraceae bacterium]|nr:DAK2 domain-containing protein [Lachnospiraceae bacterium]MDN4743487.1 DAK2 domain-containing protein [Lachnospiraceae bacterium C1.1]